MKTFALTLLAGAASAVYTANLPNNGFMKVHYDAASDRVVFDVTLQNNMWFAVGFGSSMVNTDIVAWSTYGVQSEQVDLYSRGNYFPGADRVNAYTTSIDVDAATGRVHFVSSRPMETGNANDFTFALYEKFDIIYAFDKSSHIMNYHGANRGYSSMTLTL